MQRASDLSAGGARRRRGKPGLDQDATATVRALRGSSWGKLRPRQVLWVMLVALVAVVALGLWRRRRSRAPLVDFRARALVSAAEIADLNIKVDALMRDHFDKHEALERLAQLLRFQTVSDVSKPRHLVDERAMRQLVEYLQNGSAYPLAAKALQWERVADGLSVLATLPGRQPELAPVLLISHLDVVPAAERGSSGWHHPPFAGVFDATDGYLYGRGALDTKSSATAPLEALEVLLRAHGSDYRPRRGIILAYGHDEEVGGAQGAGAIAALLRERQVSPYFSLDEGGAVAEGVITGVKGRVALIGMAEKGYSDVNITVTSEGGHASAPSCEGTVIESIARAIGVLHRARLPERLMRPMTDTFDYLAPFMPPVQRFLVSGWRSHGWLLRQIVRHDDELRAQLGSTYASTLLHAGVKENVIPSRATLIMNWRTTWLMPNPVEFVRHTLEAAGVLDAPGREWHINAHEETHMLPSSTSPLDHVFRDVQRSISVAYGADTISAPYLTFAATDSRHYVRHRVGQRHYRFSPFLLRGREDFALVHAANERIHIDVYAKMVRFYVSLLLDACDSEQESGTRRAA
ncbi:hypothetical protein CDCA_CDCA12G3394 [Cyanidium caldarium]|uniref:Peptidase M20 dimerisation domain-containing protein n=1 Tax=Cyanidium caldarium TaxID=2771 RepID=A0AAV9IYK2_CYACA|nr:hypothetical protein CDCA_CDCA12G3394 [Cyanidium caldarium]